MLLTLLKYHAHPVRNVSVLANNSLTYLYGKSSFGLHFINF